MILDTPHGDLVEISSSSYGLLLFSSKVGSRHDAGAGVIPGGSSSISIGELWPDIDKLHEAGHERTSMISMWSLWGHPALHCQSGSRGLKRIKEGVVESCLERGVGNQT
jgi:hypothetical protein